MNVRAYEQRDYPIIAEWWPLWGWPVIPQSILPDVGFVADGEFGPVVAAWMYVAAPVGWLGWPISDRAASSRERANGIDGVIAAIEDFAKVNGLKAVMTSTGHRGLCHLYANRGWKAGETGATGFTKIIGA